MPPATETSDADVDEHRRWLQSVFDRYQRPLLSYAWRLVNGDTELARDCVQDTFLALCQQPRSAVDGHVDAWLFKSCRNRAMDHHRREARMRLFVQSTSPESKPESIHDPSVAMERSEEQQLVEQQIQQLPAREQELLALRLSHGMSYKQIAEITGLSPSNVGFLLHQALVKLKTALA
jgi:RNA polymerase sigma-70 factor, ECF subfamily